MLRPTGDSRLLPITRSGLFEIERAKPGDEPAAVQIEDLRWLKAWGDGGIGERHLQVAGNAVDREGLEPLTPA